MKKNITRRDTPKAVSVTKPAADQFPPVSGLWFGSHESKPRNYSWSEGYAETWEFYEAKVRDEGRGDELPEDSDPDFQTNFDGSEGYTLEGPMMNYFYPMPTYHGDPREDCKKLARLPVCIIEFIGEDVDSDDRYALALTGGGMDLSWEICEAFMRLGYLPPVHFAGQLPQMCGRGTSALDRWIIAGCQRSLRGEKESVGRALRRLRENFPAGGAK